MAEFGLARKNEAVKTSAVDPTITILGRTIVTGYIGLIRTLLKNGVLSTFSHKSMERQRFLYIFADEEDLVSKCFTSPLPNIINLPNRLRGTHGPHLCS